MWQSGKTIVDDLGKFINGSCGGSLLENLKYEFLIDLNPDGMTIPSETWENTSVTYWEGLRKSGWGFKIFWKSWAIVIGTTELVEMVEWKVIVFKESTGVSRNGLV